MKPLPLLLICAALAADLCACSFGTGPDDTWSNSGNGSGSVAGPSRDFARPEIGTPVEINPSYDFDPSQMQPEEFGGCFSEDHPVEVSSYKLAEGTNVENEVVVLRGHGEGPCIYVVAGVHGDEIAAWMSGDLLKKAAIRAGTLHILSPANPWGASTEPRSRYVMVEEDLNRSFPGDREGTMAQRAADAIYQDISRVAPDFVFDLHEAQVNEADRDFLGSSIIFTSLDGISELCMGLLQATESGELCSERFNFFGPGPEGSVNQAVTAGLDIPVLTVETYRGYPLERRIGDQLAIVEYGLTYYGLL